MPFPRGKYNPKQGSFQRPSNWVDEIHDIVHSTLIEWYVVSPMSAAANGIRKSPRKNCPTEQVFVTKHNQTGLGYVVTIRLQVE